MTLSPIRIDLIEIPKGIFHMGSQLGSQNETPVHTPSLKTFFISRYPVTNHEYSIFVTEARYREPLHWVNKDVLLNQGNHPVVNIAFGDAEAYCRWLSHKNQHTFCLPTEAAWEKAARGSLDERSYPWGDEWATFRCNSKESGRGTTSPVNQYENAQKNFYGICDMVGNVWEWTSSRYEAYPESLHTSSKYGQEHRVVRGGSYQNDGVFCRVSQRGCYLPETIRSYVGFRIASNKIFASELIHSDPNDKHRAIDPAKLQQALIKHFNLLELRQLMFDLKLPYEDLDLNGGLTKTTRELVTYCQRHGLIYKLIKQADKARPTVGVDWWQTSENRRAS